MSEALRTLPAELAQHRVLNTNDTARFCAVSVVHWRRLYRKGLVPDPVKLGQRRLGWRLCDLIGWLDRRATGG